MLNWPPSFKNQFGAWLSSLCQVRAPLRMCELGICYTFLLYLVIACLEALKCVLPAQLVVQAHIACYTLAQGPHSQPNEGDWAWFTRCVLDLMGFPADDRLRVCRNYIFLNSPWFVKSLNTIHELTNNSWIENNGNHYSEVGLDSDVNHNIWSIFALNFSKCYLSFE